MKRSFLRLFIAAVLFVYSFIFSSCGITEREPETAYNELGKVFVVEYHRIAEKDGAWTRSAENFKKDLQAYYDLGFRLVSIKDFFNEGKAKVPAGKKPLIMTFDDATASQFKWLIVNGATAEGSGGYPKIDPSCAVGILDEFHKKHPDFGRAATFFCNSNPFYQPEAKDTWKLKLKYLVKTGREIGNHTYGHDDLSKLDFNGIKKTLAMQQSLIEEALPSYEASSVALPFGALPKRGRWLLQAGEYGGKAYRYKVAFLVGWSPTLPPYHKDFDPAMVQRVQADDTELAKWFAHLKKNPGDYFVSDGDPNKVSIQEKDRDLLDRTQLKAGTKVAVYDGRKKLSETTVSSKKNRLSRLKTSDKGVYYTFHSAGIPSRIDDIITNYKKTGLNTLVIDMKDVDGILGVDLPVPLAESTGAKERIYIKDLRSLVAKLHADGVIVSARISVFKDRFLAKKRPDLALHGNSGSVWTENDGVNWVNPFSKEVWKYNVDIAEAAILAGADEVQFDYIRFPEKGRVENILIPKDKEKYYAIEGFLRYAYERLEKYDASIAIDVFGVMSWLKDVDISITGQRVGEMAKYVFVVCPMLYPSHFDSGFDGCKSPVDEPYVFMKRGAEKTLNLMEGSDAKMVAWIQGFDWRVKNFDENYVLQQKKALNDLGISSFLVWNAGNRYSVTYSALTK